MMLSLSLHQWVKINCVSLLMLIIPHLKNKVMFNKIEKGVEITCMEETLVSCKYVMEIIGHKNPISYENKFFFLVLQLFLFRSSYSLIFFLCFCIILTILFLVLFLFCVCCKYDSIDNMMFCET
jgi:hypothetical protein